MSDDKKPKPTGGQCHPVAYIEEHGYGPVHQVEWGATLRDKFAGDALIGILSSEGDTITSPSWAAARAYKIADAMIEARGT